MVTGLSAQIERPFLKPANVKFLMRLESKGNALLFQQKEQNVRRVFAMELHLANFQSKNWRWY